MSLNNMIGKIMNKKTKRKTKNYNKIKRLNK